MAGAGYKLFSTGDVLSASDVNTYLQQQTVMVFASAAARTTALASVLAEGMLSYLKDTDAVEKYTGSAWTSISGGGGGKVFQVVNATYGTAAQIASSTWTDTGLTVSITPTLNTSKVLVLVQMNGVGKSGSAAAGVGLRVLRGATSIVQFEELAGYCAANDNDIGGSGTTYLDSPATTSATTYKVQFNNYGAASGNAKINRAGGGTTSTITVLEIGA
jgi:hypothetical protein